ncbi:hypothetical protein BGX38DRAFT_1289004 [Terfezia claveryi]|nr:hypothetical protein BGX38DRAFT_1289004 [Terfezia claveryi]
MAKKTKLEEDDRLWKTTRKHKRRVEVLDTAEAIRSALLLCHEGLGHRQLSSAYEYFSKRYWVPAAAKVVQRHIEACKICQVFSKPNKLQSPGYIPQGGDIFTHWLIDSAGPFPKDLETGDRYKGNLPWMHPQKLQQASFIRELYVGMDARG